MSHYTTNPINALARQVALAFDEYKKHPSLMNQSTLMDCLDDFIAHFNSLEELINTDIFNIKAEE